MSLCVISVALGGCLWLTVLCIYRHSTLEEMFPYFIVGLVGEVTSLLGLVSLIQRHS